MKDRRSIFSWCLYDWAHSSFPTLVTTFIFSTYYTKTIAPNEIIGTEYWGYALAVAGFCVAILAPLVGAIADNTRSIKKWLGIMTFICIISVSFLFFVKPDGIWIVLALIIYVIADIAYECSQIFYNSLLVRIAPSSHIGRISGWGWGIGYFGGLCCLIIALWIINQKLFSNIELFNIRCTMLLVGVWFAIFSLPMFFWTNDLLGQAKSIKDAIIDGIKQLFRTIRCYKEYKNIYRYLLAHLLYMDGLNTIFAFGGIYAAGTFGMGFSQIILFAISLNISAGIGAILLASLDDLWHPKRVILISLVGIVVVSSIMLFIKNILLFWIVGVILGFFMGPAQAASRSFMVRLSPRDKISEMFGVYSLSGRMTAFLGPMLVAMFTSLFHSQRVGLSMAVILIILGLIVLLKVKRG
jgi:MFS transporter, UMF1 family